MGTVTGIAAEAGLAEPDGSVPGIGRVLLVDSVAAIAGGVGGVSSNTTFIESAAGVAEGGRTGFASVVTGVLFLLAVFLSPLAGIIPTQATAPALVVVGYLMFTLVKDINVADVEDGIPALLTIILMPLTYDITGRHRRRLRELGLHQGHQGQARRDPPAHVGGLDRLRHLLRQGLDPDHHQVVRDVVRERPFLSLHHRPVSHPGRRPVPVPSAAMFERTALPPGPRVISARLPGGAFGLHRGVRPGRFAPRDARAGRRRALHGAHHVQGNGRVSSTRAISEAIEGVGGSFNAATDRESTVYWVRVPRREAARAMDVLGELIVRPTLADHEIEGERAVIVEEIRSYLDDPAEYAQILFQQAMFGDGALGREICGDEAGIRALPEKTIRDFWGAAYRPANVVVAVAGDLDHKTAVDHAERAFGRGNGVVQSFAPAPPMPGGQRYLLGHRDATQAHLAVGVPSLRRDHPDSWILGVLNTVLGDGMSSRLFLSVREEKGLAYDVGSGIADYADAGASVSRPGSIRSTSSRPSPRSSSNWHGSAMNWCRRRSWPRPRPTCRAVSSCGWRRPVTSRRGSAARRRSTTGS